MFSDVYEFPGSYIEIHASSNISRITLARVTHQGRLTGKESLEWSDNNSGQSLPVLEELGIVFLIAVRTDSVAELSLGMLIDIPVNLLPVTLIVSNLLAKRAYGEQAAQSFYL
jgi:hypothetical protein